jgi:GNAT superfamily N-acetyltransferase
MDEHVLQIERATVASWRAREQADIHGWLLQAEDGQTGRGNSAAPHAWTGDDVEAAIDEVEAWYRARGLRSQFRICEGAAAPADIAQRLEARDYTMHTPTLVMTRLLADAPNQRPSNITLTPNAAGAFDQVFSATDASAADIAERRAIIARAPTPKAHAVAAVNGEPVAVGMCVITGAYAGVMAMRTLEKARRHGAARAIVDALLSWARDAGAQTAHLQVEAQNTPAIALYEHAGFTTLARYALWRAP